MGSYRVTFWLPPEEIGLMNPWMSNNSANTYFFSFKPTTNYLVFSDVDECNSTIPVCDANAECANTIGSHSCSCKAGFTGNGKKCVGKLVKWLLLLPEASHFKTKQNQNNLGLIWTLDWKKIALIKDWNYTPYHACHVQLIIRRDAFANNRHFR